MSREELLEKLRALLEIGILYPHAGGDAEARDREAEHKAGEELLLEYIGDPKVTKLWEELSNEWWYS